MYSRKSVCLEIHDIKEEICKGIRASSVVQLLIATLLELNRNVCCTVVDVSSVVSVDAISGCKITSFWNV
jgi:hypothetical protein